MQPLTNVCGGVTPPHTNTKINIDPRVFAHKGLETPGIDRYDKISLLVNRWLTQIHLVASGGPPKVVKARRNAPKWGAIALVA